METYDFIKLCNDHKVDVVGCLKVISDVCGKDNKLPRLECSFEKVIPLLKQIINTAGSDGYVDVNAFGIEKPSNLSQYSLIYLINKSILSINSMLIGQNYSESTSAIKHIEISTKFEQQLIINYKSKVIRENSSSFPIEEHNKKIKEDNTSSTHVDDLLNTTKKLMKIKKGNTKEKEESNSAKNRKER